jgi:hypothetical protein
VDEARLLSWFNAQVRSEAGFFRAQTTASARVARRSESLQSFHIPSEKVVSYRER